MRYLLAALFALALLSVPPAVQAQYCWDTGCAAGTPAADCWRAWCPTWSPPTWSVPTYSPSYTYPTWGSAPAPRALSLGEQWFRELGRNTGCTGYAGLYC